MRFTDLHAENYKSKIEEMGLSEVVKFKPTIPYKNALKEMLDSDALLIFQASNCNHQIPAKLYEYFRAQKPILLLTDKAGDTAILARKHGIDTIASFDDKNEIVRELSIFLKKITTKSAPIAPIEEIKKYSRASQTAQLSKIFHEVKK